MADSPFAGNPFKADFGNISVEIWDALFERNNNGKGKSELQVSFDLALRACAQDDDEYKR